MRRALIGIILTVALFASGAAFAHSNPSGCGPLPYLSERLVSPTYKSAFAALFRGKRNVSPWLQAYIRSKNGGEAPGVEIEIGGQQFEFHGVCEPHNCDRSFIHFLFLPGGKQAWAFFTGENGQYRLFGKSASAAETAETLAIDYLLRSANETWSAR